MSSAGNPYHNAHAESFMKTIKVEQVNLAGYETCADVAARLQRFIDEVCNGKRLQHSAIYPPTISNRNSLGRRLRSDDPIGPTSRVHSNAPSLQPPYLTSR